jgi:hypothetical protein
VDGADQSCRPVLRIHQQFAWPADICNITTADYRWFRYFFFDEAFFHLWVVIGDVVARFLQHGAVDDISHDIMQHLVEGIRLTSRMIDSGQPVSDQAIACVQFLYCISYMFHRLDEAKMHFDGMCKMIELRGGLKSFEHADESMAGEARLLVDPCCCLCPVGGIWHR